MDLKQVSPKEIAATTTVPVLLIRGRRDDNIPAWHSRKVLARSPCAVLWEVPYADHCGAISGAHRELEQRHRLGYHNPHLYHNLGEITLLL